MPCYGTVRRVVALGFARFVTSLLERALIGISAGCDAGSSWSRTLLSLSGKSMIDRHPASAVGVPGQH